MFNKSPFLTLFLLFLWTNTPQIFGEENPFVQKFPLKAGLIHYAIRGSRTGTRLLYFSDYGRKQLLIEKTDDNILQPQKQSGKVTLITPDGKYIIDTKKGIALKEPLLEAILYQKFQKLTKKEQQKILANIYLLKNRSLQNSNGICILHAKKVAGLWCNEEQINGKTQCSIAGGTLVLDSKIDILGYHVKVFVTSIEKKEIDPSHFTLPSDIQVLEKQTDMETHAKIILTQLRRGDKALLCQPKTAASSQGEELHQIMYEEIQNLSKNF